MWTYSSPELYELLMIGRGWPATRDGSFVAQGLIRVFLAVIDPKTGYIRDD